MVGFLRDYFLGLVSNIRPKVASTAQGTECWQAPRHTEKMCFLPLRSLQSGGKGADDSQSQSWVNHKVIIKANASSPQATVGGIIWELIKMRGKTDFGREFFRLEWFSTSIVVNRIDLTDNWKWRLDLSKCKGWNLTVVTYFKKQTDGTARWGLLHWLKNGPSPGPVPSLCRPWSRKWWRERRGLPTWPTRSKRAHPNS